MISNKEVKRTFKIVLNSYNTNSYTGTQFNANYLIDLTKIINDEIAFDKSYYVYCAFISNANNIATNTITTTTNYMLSLNFNNSSIQVYNYNLFENYDFILPVQNLTDTGGAIHTQFYLNDNNQKPLFIQNIRNLTNINLKVSQLGTTGTPLTENVNNLYMCTLTFVEA